MNITVVGHVPFSRHSYKLDILPNAYARVNILDHASLISAVEKKGKSEETLILTVTYYPSFTLLKDIVWKCWDLVKKSSSTKSLSENKIINAYKRLKNLRDILVKAKHCR